MSKTFATVPMPESDKLDSGISGGGFLRYPVGLPAFGEHIQVQLPVIDAGYCKVLVRAATKKNSGFRYAYAIGCFFGPRQQGRFKNIR